MSAEEPCNSEQACQGRLHLYVHDFSSDQYCDSCCGHISIDQMLVKNSTEKKEKKRVIALSHFYFMLSAQLTFAFMAFGLLIWCVFHRQTDIWTLIYVKLMLLIVWFLQIYFLQSPIQTTEQALDKWDRPRTGWNGHPTSNGYNLC